MKQKVSDIISEFLEKSEIKTVFGIIGSANAHIFDSITKRGYTQIVCVHHEQAAVMAMGAYFRACGKMSAAIITAGAGSSNAITGVLSNWADSIPGIIISGQEQSKFIENYKGMRMYGIQGFDAPNMVKDITKYAKTIMDETSVQSELEKAYSITQSPRSGPVWLDFPFDIQSRMIEKRDWNLKVENNLMQFDAAPVMIQMDLDYVIKQLQESKRPVLWAGHGVRLAGIKEDFRKLVDLLQIPTILTWGGIDLLHDEHPFYFGRAGVSGMRHSNFIVQNSDFILVIGNRLSLLQTGYDISQFAPHAKIAVVDVDQTEWKKHPATKYDRSITMDCRIFVKEMLDANTTFLKSDWMSYCQKMKAKYPLIEECHYQNKRYVNSYEFINFLNDKLKGNEIIVTDMGTALLSGHYAIRLKKDNLMFTSLGLGEMGYGLPGAIGAAFAYPDRDIICLNCDGGMMMNLQELQTIVHHNLRIKIIVFDNDGYLMIKHTQKMLFGKSRNSVDKATGVSCPNYTWLAHSMELDEFLPMREWNMNVSRNMEQFLASRGPSLIVVKMDPEQDFLPKVKGVVNADGTISPANLEEMSPLLPYKDIEEAMISGVNEKSKLIKR